jgi:hypothetical protein
MAGRLGICLYLGTSKKEETSVTTIDAKNYSASSNSSGETSISIDTY